ncbi:MAG: PAS domain-containing protein [Rudaea sp.]|uniref:helix-turn-helix transcriptional regulator n=1 Tax=Rudaea sp. TaxID=2136325 RepID=UPI0039E4E254
MPAKPTATRRQARKTRPARRSEPAPALRAERDALFSQLHPIVDVVGGFVGENVEIVLHDLTRPESSVVKILNGHVSGRSVGDSILSGPGGDRGFVELLRSLEKPAQGNHSLIGDYRTIARSGKMLQSSTVIFRDSRGVNFASLCVNADMSVVVQAHALLQSMLAQPKEPVAAAEAPAGIDVLMKEIIVEAVQKFGKPVSAMGKAEKTHAVEAMLQRGLFIVKGGVERAATALGVTRFTVYNYLDAIRSRNGDESPARKRARRKNAQRMPGDRESR